ncbi:reverse transcriptase domain-containing protein [Phyllobacterium zundukense]|uniref:Reverse transcriptase domain-containing protein n=1 Tax=Phyllobacterium zundukense TaxID=1867719 RepID=A0A2N9W461_9HYPH|nr:reverse transcriptase domain-containing protein [Phyllobacterium zundukense]ATU92001.1 hypothetical protein BLM14_10440 [Phyllobacterium zundukense]PIO46529.1 hypothetical protein B5P45_01640 [Phyllobacterium zundukense]
MVHQFENFEYSYWKNGKPYYAPNDFGRKLGKKLKTKIEDTYQFADFNYHFREGAHIQALHDHRANKFFCRVDIERFFYSVKRNRVKRALKEIGINKPEYYAKWSTVKNPYDDGGYVVPYGFVQSPIVATLVVALSPIGIFLRNLDPQITRSIYMDDICLSGADKALLETSFAGLCEAVADSGFLLNTDKTREPAPMIDIFNCDLEHARSEVLQTRKDEYYSVEHTDQSISSFEQYCSIVESADWRSAVAAK